MSVKAVCITGGAGFIGSHLAAAFVGQGCRVLVIDDLSSGRRENLPAEAEFHPLDIRSPEAAELLAGAGPDLLVHQAAQMDVRRSVADPVFDADVNVVGSLNLFEAARRGGVSQILFASTGGVIYGEQERLPTPEDVALCPLCPYGVAKLAIERYLFYYCATYGIDAACLRYANVYGERQNPHGEAGVVAIFLNHLLAGRRPTIHGDGEQTRDYIHVSDVVRANLAAVGRKGFLTYNVGTGRETSVVELFRELAAVTGIDIEPRFGPAKSGEQRRSAIDSGRLRAELGVADPLELREGLRRTAAWFREHPPP